MTHAQPPDDPAPNDTWVNDLGDLYTWDGKEWVPFEDLPWFGPNSAVRDS